MPKVRLLRVMEIIGEERAVLEHLSLRTVKGSKTFKQRMSYGVEETITINEAILGDLPEIIEEVTKSNES